VSAIMAGRPAARNVMVTFWQTRRKPVFRLMLWFDPLTLRYLLPKLERIALPHLSTRLPMARKSEAAPAVHSVTASKTANALRTLRERIDKLDLQILKLINDRASLAVEVGRLKAEQGGDVFSPAREEEVLKNVLEVNAKNGGPLPDVTVRAVF